MLRYVTVISALTVLLLGAGCVRTQPVHSVTDAPVVTGSANAASLEQVRGAITKAAQSKRWRVEQIEDGHMVATVVVRKHTAVVDIRYTTSDYDITYKDSKVLLYDGQTIHRNYNKWVKLLDEAISQELNAL